MRVSGFFVAFAMVLLAGTTSPSSAESLLNAMSMKPLPDGRAIAVRALDNSDDNLALEKAVITALQSAGYVIDANSDLVLSLETNTQVSSSSQDRRSTFFEFETGGGRSGGEQTTARLNLFDSSTGGLLNPQRNRELYSTTESVVRIDVTIDDYLEKGRVWQAWITTDSDTASQKSYIGEVIAENLGKVIKRQSLEGPAR